MMLVSNLLLFISIPIVLIALLYKYLSRNFNYWKIRGIPGPVPLPFVGNIWDLCTFKLSIGDFVKKLYGSFNEPCIGFFIFDEPFLLIKSPEIAKAILVRDFNNFKDRTIAFPKHDEIFANALFVQKSPQWKNDRSKLTPLFSSAKLKLMFSSVKDIGNNLVKFLKEHPGTHDAKDICSNYSIDVIGKCFFGVDALSFQEKSGHFAEVGKAMMANSIRNGIIKSIYFFKSGLVDLMRLRFFDRDVQNFFVETFLNTVKSREAMNLQATDFVKILMDISKEDPSFGHTKIASEGMQFFTAGFETSASTIAFTLYEMALNPGIQQKLRNEILWNIEKYKDITYSNLQEMKYLHLCVMESLRKYPPLPFLDRRCDLDYPIPGTNFVVEKGIPVYISVSAIQNDEKYFPNPERYDPNRFEENVNENQLVHFPFGFGPRACIGERFGLVSVKLALVHLISNFEVERLPTTPVPIVFDPKVFTSQSTVGLPVRLKEIERSAPLVY